MSSIPDKVCVLVECPKPVAEPVNARFCTNAHKITHNSRLYRERLKLRLPAGHVCSQYCIPLEVNDA